MVRRGGRSPRSKRQLAQEREALKLLGKATRLAGGAIPSKTYYSDHPSLITKERGFPKPPSHLADREATTALLESARTPKEAKRIVAALIRDAEEYDKTAAAHIEKRYTQEAKAAADRAEQRRDAWSQYAPEDAWDVVAGAAKYVGKGAKYSGVDRQVSALKDVLGPVKDAVDWGYENTRGKKGNRLMQTGGPSGGDELFKDLGKHALRGAGEALAAIPTFKPILEALGTDNETLLKWADLVSPVDAVGGVFSIPAKAAGRVAKATKALDNIGAVGVMTLPRYRRLLREGSTTGDMTKLADALEHVQKQLKASGKIPERVRTTTTQDIFAASQARRADGVPINTKAPTNRWGLKRRNRGTRSHALHGREALDVASATLRRDAARMRRPGFQFGLANPLTGFQPNSRASKYSLRLNPDAKWSPLRGRRIMRVASQSRAPLAVERARRAAHEESRESIQQLRAERLREGITRDEQVAIQGKLDEQTTLRDDEVTRAGKEAAKNPPARETVLEHTARRGEFRSAREAALMVQSLERAFTGANERLLQDTLKILDDEYALVRAKDRGTRPKLGLDTNSKWGALVTGGRRQGKAEALDRIMLHLWAREGESTVNLAQHAPLSATETEVADQLQAAFQQMLKQGRDLGFLHTGRPNYVARQWEQSDEMSAFEGVLRSTVGTENFARGREYTSVFERADREGVIAHLKRGWRDMDDETAGALADELHTSAASREMAEFDARAAQRGNPNPTEAPAVAQLGRKTWEGVLFRPFDDDATEGRVLLQDDIVAEAKHGDARDRLAEAGYNERQREYLLGFESHPEGMTLERRSSEAKADATHASARATQAREQGREELAEAWDWYSDQLNEELLRLDAGSARVTEQPMIRRVGEGAVNDADYEVLQDVLSRTAVKLRDVRSWKRSPNGDPEGRLIWRIATRADQGSKNLAVYRDTDHSITLYKNNLEAEFEGPLAQLDGQERFILGRVLRHELSHARTLNKDGVLSESQELGKRGLPDERVLAESGLEAVHERVADIKERLLASITFEGGPHPNDLPWNAGARAVLKSMNFMDVSPGYGLQRQAQGMAQFRMSEGSARFFELMFQDPDTWAKAVPQELNDWLQHDLLRVQAGWIPEDLSKEALQYNDVIIGPDTNVWYTGKFPAPGAATTGPVGDMSEAVRSMATGGFLTPERRAAVLKARAERKLDRNEPPDMNEPPPGHPDWGGDETHILEHTQGKPGMGYVTESGLLRTWTSRGTGYKLERHHLTATLHGETPTATFHISDKGTVEALHSYRSADEFTEGQAYYGMSQPLPQGHWAEDLVANVFPMQGRESGFFDRGAASVYEPGPTGDPWDRVGRLPERPGAHLPDARAAGEYPVVDPKAVGFYRARAQSRAASFAATWRAYDQEVGRSTDDGRLRPEGDRWVDTETNDEFVKPHIQGRALPGLADNRVWPVRMQQEANNEFLRLNDYEDIVRTASENFAGSFLTFVRWSVTSPFPAYHARNMASDIMQSLMLDTGVLFHPVTGVIALHSLVGDAFLKQGGRGMPGLHGMKVNIPGIGKTSWEDFLFTADLFGLRSGEHLADFGRILNRSDAPDQLGRRLGRAFQRSTMQFGARREDTMRLATFVQRMRRNGGDAADAAWHVMNTHFNYGDLTRFERRFMRNVFLFYTWYRKNIPLQLATLVRRPGFFVDTAHNYEAAQRGDNPWLNVDWSDTGIPFAPDLSGEFPAVNELPDYIRDRMGAWPINWNGMATYVAIGAPWADLALLRPNPKEGIKQLIPLLNPAFTTLIGIAAQRDLVSWRKLRRYEPSTFARLAEAAGFEVRYARDAKGGKDLDKPTLPFWVNLLAQGLSPGASRALTPLRPDASWQEALGPTVLGANINRFPANEAELRTKIAASRFETEWKLAYEENKGLSFEDQRELLAPYAERLLQFPPAKQREVVDSVFRDPEGGATIPWQERLKKARLLRYFGTYPGLAKEKGKGTGGKYMSPGTVGGTSPGGAGGTGGKYMSPGTY